MILSSWNVNSVRARIDNILGYLDSSRPDILMMQEIKTEEKNFPYNEFKNAGYNSFVSGQKSYNGVAFLSKKNIKKFRKELIISQVIRDSINHMVTDIIENSKRNINRYEIKSLNNIYSCNKPIICFSNKMKEADNQIKFFLNDKMYNNKYVLKKTNEGKKIIKNLFNKLNKNPKKYIRNDLLKTGIKERVIADFIAGMTDRFAINLNRNF